MVHHVIRVHNAKARLPSYLPLRVRRLRANSPTSLTASSTAGQLTRRYSILAPIWTATARTSAAIARRQEEAHSRASMIAKVSNQEVQTANTRSPSLHGVLSALTVGLIATPRSDFVLASIDMPMDDVRSRAQAGPYDYLPVTDGGGGSIVGIIDLRNNEVKNAAGRARDHYLRLEERLLVGADAPISAFIAELEERPFRFVISGATVDGLVTVSDLHKLPVRVALFAMIVEFEMTLAEAIRRHWPGGYQGWSTVLPKEESNRLAGWIKRARTNNMIVDELLLTSLKQKLILSEKILPSSTGDDVSGALIKLRDSLAHSLDYVETPAQAAELSLLVANVEKRTAEMRPVPAAG